MNARDDRARELAALAVSLTEADQAEALAVVGEASLTRFAGNRIHQNVAEENSEVSVRAVLGTRVGVASTNRTDTDSLRACCASAAEAAEAAPEDPGFPGLPAPSPVVEADRAHAGTLDYGAERRAMAAHSIIEQSSTRGLTAAGGVKTNVQGIAVANSLGVDVAQTVTGLRATVLSMGEDGGAGWASYVTADATDLPSAALGDEAASIAERSANPQDLEPGSYAVVLTPEAVADLVEFLGYLGFSAKAVEEGRSFMSDKLGERIMGESVSIVDDAIADHAMGLTFDFEGMPKRRTTLIDRGVAAGPVTDSYWAARLERPNTGHALPAPNSYGPMPLNLEMAPGDQTIDELISSVEHGVYVTRFHYVNVEDPVPATLTGMTRDGTFMIENGRLTRPLRNLRFTQSVVEAFSDVRGITHDRLFVGSETNPALVPGMLLGAFRFTGQTS